MLKNAFQTQFRQKNVTGNVAGKLKIFILLLEKVIPGKNNKAAMLRTEKYKGYLKGVDTGVSRLTCRVAIFTAKYLSDSVRYEK